jgi:hypothetical protein
MKKGLATNREGPITIFEPHSGNGMGAIMLIEKRLIVMPKPAY